ncbi:MAG: DNA mismatch repair endonuclease MutL [Tissierellia bacterium]|nr:DNA mismatch repair endonuclease MutL [Tissierellia bacterium]
MGKIKVLDDLTIQKIAAGEVIERPSSVVKELIENALDANSTNITIETREGGKKYIRITDDGDGIYENDLINAFKPHSTSKLAKIDDLYNINSFGFRGEALASISSVAKVEVLTKTEKNVSGIQAFVEESKIIKQLPVGCPKGTTMIVRDLFYNLPVRRKFLKSNTVEGNYITDIVYKLALGNCGVSFKYIKDNQVVLNTSKNNNLRDNIYILLGKEFIDGLMEIQFENEDFKIYGYISNNQFYRGNRSHQYLYVNNRYVKNVGLTNIIETKYKSLIPINRFPIFVLFVYIDPSLIDVNIHPTKEEVKFVNEEEFNTKLEYIIDKTLKDNLAVPKATFTKEPIEKKDDSIPLLYEEKFYSDDYKLNINKNEDNTQILESMPIYEKDFNTYKIKHEEVIKRKEDINRIDGNRIDGEDDLKNILKRLKYIGIIFSTYIIAEDTLSNRVFIIDQHAAHERILYEKYKKEYEMEKVIIQPLLTPEIVELTDSEITMVLENIELLKNLGFVVEEFGNNSIIIRGVPVLFGEPQLKSLFLEIIDNISSIHNKNYEYRTDKIMKIACSNAIKGGDKIFSMEIQSLFEQLSQVENPYTCPHGRPTIIEILKEDVEKEFKRII